MHPQLLSQPRMDPWPAASAFGSLDCAEEATYSLPDMPHPCLYHLPVLFANLDQAELFVCCRMLVLIGKKQMLLQHSRHCTSTPTQFPALHHSCCHLPKHVKFPVLHGIGVLEQMHLVARCHDSCQLQHTWHCTSVPDTLGDSVILRAHPLPVL